MTHSHHHSGGHDQHHQNEQQQLGDGNHHHGQQPAALPGFPVPYAYPAPVLASTAAVAPVLQPTRANYDRARMTTGERICLWVMGLFGAGYIILIISGIVGNAKNL